MSILFAATYPERVRALILGAAAPAGHRRLITRADAHPTRCSLPWSTAHIGSHHWGKGDCIDWYVLSARRIREMERGRINLMTGRTPVAEQRRSVPLIMSRGVPVDPRMDFAFFPSQVLADPVGGQFPVPPFLADGALRNRQYCRYLTSG